MKQLFRIIDDTSDGESFVVANDIKEAIDIFVKAQGENYKLHFMKVIEGIVVTGNNNKLYM